MIGVFNPRPLFAIIMLSSVIGAAFDLIPFTVLCWAPGIVLVGWLGTTIWEGIRGHRN